MNKLMIALSVLWFSASASAFDYREDLSPGLKPNYEPEPEMLELICAIDGVPGKQISIDITPANKNSKTDEDGMLMTIEREVVVSEGAYTNSYWTSAIKGEISRVFSRTTTVDRMTGAYEEKRFNGSGYAYINAATNSSHPQWEKSVGTCKAGKHVTEPMF